jgi:SAM-dependent methyltransferase
MKKAADRTLPRPDHGIYLKHHNDMLTRYGEDVKALSYGSPESQRIKFQVLFELGDFEGKSVLDVGCGFGDFYGFVRQRAHLKHYLGVDINPSLIDIAKRRFPGASFEVKDIIEDSIDQTFDYVVSSGIFFLKTPNWREIMEGMVSRMYELSEIAVGVNLLSSYTTGQKDSLSYYAAPTEILDFVCCHLSTRVILRHDYRPNDFTLYIYKPFARPETG